MPFLWKMLLKRGNSNAEERKEPLNEYIELFGVSSILSFLADRKFIGEPWFDELIKNRVPFYIRIKGI